MDLDFFGDVFGESTPFDVGGFGTVAKVVGGFINGGDKSSKQQQQQQYDFKELTQQRKRSNQVNYSKKLEQLGGVYEPMKYRGSPATQYRQINPMAAYTNVLRNVGERNPYVGLYASQRKGPGVKTISTIADSSAVSDTEESKLMQTALSNTYNTWRTT